MADAVKMANALREIAKRLESNEELLMNVAEVEDALDDIDNTIDQLSSDVEEAISNAESVREDEDADDAA